MVTDKEKEALFIEFEEERMHLLDEVNAHINGHACESKSKMKPANQYFWDKYLDMTMSYDFHIWRQHGIGTRELGLIRLLVCVTYGVYAVRDLPDDKLDEANALAMEIIDTLFDTNRPILEELQKKQNGEL